MALETIDGTYHLTNLQESHDYAAAREELRLAEIELMRQRETVAEMRRRLPAGARLEDYVFQEGPANLDAGDVPVRRLRLSQLFSAPDRSLIFYHLMFGKRQRQPCPMCTSWVDVIDPLVIHLKQQVDMAVVAATDPAALRALARKRGWRHIRLVSAGDSTFKYDLGSEDREGNQDAAISVFTLDEDGTPRHFYTTHPRMSPDIKTRGIDLFNPIWNYLDLTPEGRGDFVAKLEY
jgi:predicted dithiol-disulfide oxidoreductase (DUF899 family)